MFLSRKKSLEFAQQHPSGTVRAWQFAALVILSLLCAGLVRAYQVQTSSSGTGPVVKTYPSSLTATHSFTGASTTVFAASTTLAGVGNPSTTYYAPAIATTTNAIELDISANGCVNTTFRCSNRGTMTIAFNKTVTNPVLHLSGLGGNTGGTQSMYHASLNLTSWTATGTPTLTRVAGNTNLTVTGSEIRSTTINGGTNCQLATNAGCGSVRINGTVSSVTFRIDLLMGGTGPNPTASAVEGITYTVTTDDDYSDSPAAYQTAPMATHVVGGAYMGAGVTADGASTLYSATSTTSPVVSTTASADGNDDGVTFPTMVWGRPNEINVAVTGSGGFLQGWIDWAADNSYNTAGDRIATNLQDGGVGDLDGAVNGNIRFSVTAPAGTTQLNRFARFRWSTTSGLNWNGAASDGEVEDYQVTIYPQRNDLSLTKAVSDASPANGAAVSYTLNLTSAASGPTSNTPTTGVTVQDTLPSGFTFTSVSAGGTGTYNNATGVWTVGTLSPGTTASITINGTVSAASGAVTNVAQVTASSVTDPDSTVNNGVTTEDDYASVPFTVASVLPAPICPAGGTNQTISNGTFATGTGPSWPSWTAGAVWFGTGVAAVDNDTTSGTLSQSGLSGLKFGPSGAGGAVIQLSQWWRNGSPAASSAGATLTVSLGGTNYAVVTTPTGGGTSATVTYLNGASGNLTSLNEFASTGWRINIPTTVNATGALAFAYAPGGGTLDDDFEVDNVTLYTCTPGQLSATKISSVISDGISVSNPKAIPGAIVQYCIVVANVGTVTASDVLTADDLPANTEYIPGSMRTGASCGSASQSEDEDNSGADETNPFGMSFASGGSNGTGIVTGTASSLAPGTSVAWVFNVTLE